MTYYVSSGTLNSTNSTQHIVTDADGSRVSVVIIHLCVCVIL